MSEMIEGTNLPVKTSVTELARLGRKKEIRELSRRLADLSPGGITLTNDEALALAQYSWSLGANPLVGEAWLLKNQKTGKVLGLMPGIRLHRRRADEKDERTNDARWIEYTNISDPDERATFAIPQNAMAIKARLYRQTTTKTYADAAAKLADAGASWDEIKLVLGTKPYIEGIGILTKQEMDAMNRGANKMPHKQRCEKRAEAHALKQAYHLPFGYVALSDEGLGIPEGATLDEYIIEGSFSDVPNGDDIPADDGDALFQEEDKKKKSKKKVAKGTGKPRLKNQWEQEVVDAAMDLNLANHEKHVRNRLNYSTFLDEVPYGELAVEDGIAYLMAWEYSIEKHPDDKAEQRAARVNDSWIKYTGKAIEALGGPA